MKARLRSIYYALQGLRDFFKSEPNTWIHLLATAVVIFLGFYLVIGRGEWIALVIVMGMVWVAELFNTAIEKIMDLYSKERKDEIRFIKDVAAAAVLLAALTAVIVGLIIFIPAIQRWLNNAVY